MHRMRVWMHKNANRLNAHYMSEEFNYARCTQPIDIVQKVLDAVVQYNEMLPLSRNIKGNDINERLINEAEEESAKLFLDGILDIVQRGNNLNDNTLF